MGSLIHGEAYKMRRLHFTGVVLAAASLFGASCAEEQPPINQVGVNVVDKSVFEGSWYYTQTVVEVDYEGSGVGTYVGDMAYDFASNDLGSIPRVRWVIDEDFLYAYRDYELLEGGDGAPRESAFENDDTESSHMGHPVAAYRIDSHFDIRRTYNPATGEEYNTLVENTTDRHWYERQYMRVDWSKNHLPGYFGQVSKLYEVIGLYNREPADLYIQEESNFPDSWRPQFNRMQCDAFGDANCSQADRWYAADYESGELYHMSFVTQDLLSPGLVPDPFTGSPVNWCMSIYSDRPTCASVGVYIRNSFLKVSDQREYEPVNWNDTRFERHAFFRMERPTYDRSTEAGDPAYFATDFLNYNVNRHNIWREHFQKDAEGNVLRDESGRPVPMAYQDREVRPIVWTTTPELPGHLVKPAFELVSEWNEVLMRTVRQVRGQAPAEYPPTACQTENPDGYCYCTTDPDTDEVLNPTCAGRYDPFQSPDEAAAAGVISSYDCYVDVPETAEPDLNDASIEDPDFYGWFETRMVGSECVNILEMNTCNRASISTAAAEAEGLSLDSMSDSEREQLFRTNLLDPPGLECQERGDNRFKFLSYVDSPGTAFLGIATLRSDPVTGEIIAGDANIGGPALDGYRTMALQSYDLANGNTTEQEFLIGEDVRSYLEALNNVELPAPPRVDFNVAMANNNAAQRDREGIDNRMARYTERGQRLAGNEGRAMTFTDLRQELVGSDIEHRLMNNWETFAMMGAHNLPAHVTPEDINDAILDEISPFRRDVSDLLNQERDLADRLARANMLMPNEYTDYAVVRYANQRANWPRARLEFTLNRNLYYETQLHELGHCLGLRHMFGASADTQNYFDDYYAIQESIPLPDPAAFDTDATPGLSPIEQVAYSDAYRAAKERRELAGIDEQMNSSIMEYTSQWYTRTKTQAGRFDLAALNFAYGNLIEVFDNAAGLELEDISPVNTPRVQVTYYQGGEVCETDADCPFSATGAQSGTLLETNTSLGLTQRCVANAAGSSSDMMCSSVDADLAEVAAGDSSPRYAAVDYRNCTDDSVGTIGWCHRFDEGDSYREVVRNASEHYHRQYLFSHFRRYRRNFTVWGALSGGGGIMGSRVLPLMDMYQNLLHQYVSDPEYRNNEGSFGFYDQFMASADTLNFFASVLSQPDVGAYNWDSRWERYTRFSADPNRAGADLRMPIGLATYTSSMYQSGLSGIQRIERVGTFYDKWLTLQLLTQRGWQTGYTRDVPFWTNFYDLFPVELQQVFTGMIQGLPEAVSPRIECGAGAFPNCEEPSLVYMDFYRGDCSEAGTAAGNCRENPETTYSGMPVLDGGSRFLLQYLSTIFALTEFPVFFDTSFQNQLFICRVGQGDCHAPAPDAVAGEDFVEYESPRYGLTFRAWQVEPSDDLPNQTSIGFAMVKEADDSATIVGILQKYRGDRGGDPYSMDNLTADDTDALAELGYAIPASDDQVTGEINRLDDRVLDLESFFNQVIQLERELGIADYLRF